MFYRSDLAQISQLRQRTPQTSQNQSASSTSSSQSAQAGNAPQNRSGRTLPSMPNFTHYPALAARTIQEIFFPSILFTEGYKFFKNNFGFRREFLANNILLASIALCSASKIWVNPWFDIKHEGLNDAWNAVTDKEITDENFYSQFYGSIGPFMLSLATQIAIYQANYILQVVLKSKITAKRNEEFACRLFSENTAYGIQLTKLVDSEESNEKVNLSFYKLTRDIEHCDSLLDLWISRINSIIDCATAYITLARVSPPITLNFFLFSITAPMLLVASIIYSFTFNTLMSFLEVPLERIYQKTNQLKDVFITSISQISSKAEHISFLQGEQYDRQKLLNQFETRRSWDLKYEYSYLVKTIIDTFIRNCEWLIPILFAIKEVRDGSMKKSQMGPAMHNFAHVNNFFTWTKDNFNTFSMIKESVRRLQLFEERLLAWSKMIKEISKKRSEGAFLKFDGSIYAEDTPSSLLATGKFNLPQGSITHFDAPSGTGKTTFFRTLGGFWPHFKGTCELPINSTEFLPSVPYILDEPLFQTVTYPVLASELLDKKVLVKEWFKRLGLTGHVDALDQSEEVDEDQPNNWSISLSDGEKKRLAFINILLKLHTKKVTFLILDEPFKGIDFDTQAAMIALLQEAIGQGAPSEGCTLLYSDHEKKHTINTHTLTVDWDKKTKTGTREFSLQAVN